MRKWIKNLLFDTVVCVVTIFDFISTGVEIDKHDTITFRHEEFEIVIKKFPKKLHLHLKSNLEEILKQHGKIPLPEDVIKSLQGKHRFNKNFHNISIIVTKQGEELVVLKNNPGKGFKIVKTPYHKTITDFLEYLMILHRSTSSDHSGIYFPVSVTQLFTNEPLVPYHPN